MHKNRMYKKCGRRFWLKCLALLSIYLENRIGADVIPFSACILKSYSRSSHALHFLHYVHIELYPVFYLESVSHWVMWNQAVVCIYYVGGGFWKNGEVRRKLWRCGVTERVKFIIVSLCSLCMYVSLNFWARIWCCSKLGDPFYFARFAIAYCSAYVRALTYIHKQKTRK